MYLDCEKVLHPHKDKLKYLAISSGRRLSWMKIIIIKKRGNNWLLSRKQQDLYRLNTEV